VHKLQGELAQAQYQLSQRPQLSHLAALDSSHDIAAYHPVNGDVISRDGSLWYQQVEVDKGSDDGVRLGDPVIGDRGLVGEVSVVGPTYSEVTLITDNTMAEAAQVEDGSGDSGVVLPAVGDPNQLTLQQLPSDAQGVRSGELVVTVGFKSGKLQDLYPPGIPVGVVAPSFNPETLANSGSIPVTPVVDLIHLSAVQILTEPHPGTQRAQLP
jgi:rod shape-determining protein MreC